MFAAVLDTCVLYPSVQRDFLLSLAVEGLYRPLWSDRILEELEYTETDKLIAQQMDSSKAERRARGLIEQIRSSFNDALVQGWEPLDGSFGLGDHNDEHVLAAAVVSGAGAIVTDNVKDFPTGKVPDHIQIIRPAVFSANTVCTSPEGALRALQQMSKRRRNPPQSVDDLLEILENRYGMVETVDLIVAVR